MASSLYIHIPFCISKCIYCDFLSVPIDEDLASRYIGALCRELALKKDEADELKSIYIGGGTPSILPVASFERIFESLRRNYSIHSSAEITVEANPGALTKQKAVLLNSLGVNRMSLGVQSFLDRELQILGRAHSSDEAARAVDMLRSSGIENLSLDLIYGIPGQTLTDWQNNLRRAINLSPKHISAYELTVEKGTRLFGLIEAGGISMSDEDLVIEMFDNAVDRLAEAGYIHYEISNYSLPGYSCIHNLNYWERGEYIAAGAGAHSFIHGYRSKNTDDISEYIKSPDQNIIPETDRSLISDKEALREFIFLGLRKITGIRLSDAESHGIDISKAAAEPAQNGLAEINNGSLRLTRKGLHIADSVILRLITDLGL